jgi:hypothetical protein
MLSSCFTPVSHTTGIPPASTRQPWLATSTLEIAWFAKRSNM